MNNLDYQRLDSPSANRFHFRQKCPWTEIPGTPPQKDICFLHHKRASGLSDCELTTPSGEGHDAVIHSRLGSKPVRVLHIDTERGWRGGEQQALYLAAGLRRRGIFSAMVCREGEPLAEKAAALGLPQFHLNPYCEWDLVAAWKLGGLAREHHIDILHAHSAHAHALAIVALALCRLTRIRLVVHRRVDFPIRRTLVNRIKYGRSVDRYIAISHCVRDAMLRYGIASERIRVVYSATDTARCAHVTPAPLRQELGVSGGAPLLMNVAMLVDHKGHTYLLRAMPLILKRFPQTKLVIVGDGELRHKLAAEARQLGVQHAVCFAGCRPDALACIAAGDVFVMTSHMEGLCTSLLDALALGVPVVATRAGGIPEIIESGVNGLLAESRNPEAIAAAVIEALANARLAELRIGRGKMLIAERFSVRHLVDRTLEVYSELTNTETGHPLGWSAAE